MIRNRFVLKGIAALCAVLTLSNLFIPTISYALTSGPTAPEATSFEPVDTTDMVNLSTGDLTYNIPLLEVPGPAGGYPLSLAYHAGIQPNEDASWVGLGWSLNPGAINRSVSGYADDHQGVSNVNRVFWEGGETETYTVGLSVGVANAASVSAGLSFSQDTYRGFGMGGYIGGGVGFSGEGSPFSLGINGRVGVTPYGDAYSSAGIGLGVGASQKEGANLGANLGLSTNSLSGVNAGAGAGITTKGSSILGASIGTGGTKPSLSVGGGTGGVNNSKAGNISTRNFGFEGDIPVLPGVNVRLGYQYQRYWIDESEDVLTSGSLFYPNTKFGLNVLDNRAYDTYNLLDVKKDRVDHSDPTKVLGGSFPDYDHYQVVAQGLSGNIRPYHFRKNLIQQNRKQNNIYVTKSHPMDQVDEPVAFRFVNDFSNRYLYQANEVNNSSFTTLSHSFSDGFVVGEKYDEGIVDNHLAGSKHVEWYTNEQIRGEANTIDPFAEGFIDQRAAGFERDNNSQIGGFMITNESGVTYHYALPVYSYDEYTKSENTEEYKEEKGDTFNELSKPEKYAYTWYLTAVTGPDFVDRNENGFTDDGDWGYWVDFQYGKWTDRHQWRNPSEGTIRDLDGEFQNYSTGKKELYYLDAIRTASHTALFIKKIRHDGKGVTNKEGGFNLRKGGKGILYPTSVLGLSCVLLLKNEQFPISELSEIRSRGTTYTFPSRVGYTRVGAEGQSSRSFSSDIAHFGHNVLDLSDLTYKPIDYNKDYQNGGDISYRNIYDLTYQDILLKSLRSIDFETNYSLAGSTSNSLSNENLYLPISQEELTKGINNVLEVDLDLGFPDSPNSTLVEEGKFTLKKLRFLGRRGQQLVPSTIFNYANNPLYRKEYYDTWGFYKNDFDSTTVDENNESLNRLTTSISAEEVDAWSLTDISTPLGASIRINYESDNYNSVVLQTQQMYRIKSVEEMSGGLLKVNFWEDDLSLLRRGDMLSISIIRASAPTLFGAMGPKMFRSDRAFVDGIDDETGSVYIRDAGLYNQMYRTDNDIEIFPDYIVGGVCGIEISGTNRSKLGGGLRVKDISIIEGGEISSTTYAYGRGYTSYEPFHILAPKISTRYTREASLQAKAYYKKRILAAYDELISVARELPGPGVMYSAVTVSEKRKGDHGDEHVLPNYTTYEFEVYKRGMVGISSEPVTNMVAPYEYEISGIKYRELHTRKMKIQDYSSRVGSLKSITLFDAQGNTISKTQNHYLHDELDGSFEDNSANYRNWMADYNEQGVIDESFSEAKFVLYWEGENIPYGENEGTALSNQYHHLGILSERETYPIVQTGQTNINFKTGITTTTENIAFDFYSGEVTQIQTADSYGNRYLSVVEPAYRKYEKMGLKVYDRQNKNMLSQTAATYTYKLNANDEPNGLLAANVQTWSDEVSVLEAGTQPNIWRKEAAYRWNGTENLQTDGTYPQTDFANHPFNFQNLSSNTSWEKTGEITKYDPYSHALEAKDINDNYAATRMDEDHRLVLATAANASYEEIAYSGAEGYVGNDRSEAGVERVDGIPSIAFAHTGEYGLKVASGKQGFRFTSTATSDKGYHASVWVYLPGNSETEEQMTQAELYYTVNGIERGSVHPVPQINKSKNWYLLDLDVDLTNGGDVVIGCRNGTGRNVYFDDFRVHPLDASMVSYVYDRDTDEVTYILDNNNIYTHYEYDAAGRLVRTSRERMNFDFGEGKRSFRADQKLQETIYNYKKQE